MRPMKHRVIRKQKNSKMCFVCGLKNSFGLHADIYELENRDLACFFTPGDEHQSYPGRLHGGIATAVLDEIIGRAILMNYEKEVWGVTLEFTTRFKKPIPLGEELRVVGRITRETHRSFEGTGEILLPDGSVAATGSGVYLRTPLDRISDFKADEQDWKVVSKDNDPAEIDI
jgi:acyl-coenzyme A thioesterase PaaI-like protein